MTATATASSTLASGLTTGLFAKPSLLSALAAAAMATAGAHQAGTMDLDRAKGPQHAHASVWEEITQAVAVVRPTEGNRDVSGTVRFERAADGVRVTALVRGLEPNSKHGFHIHQYGDATRADGTSAGSHYDPAGSDHHAPPGSNAPHHAGDMGNLEADGQGVARLDKTFRGMSIAGPDAPILGRAVVIHARPDQFDQPTGSAGDRMGIGVIGVANPEGFGRPLR